MKYASSSPTSEASAGSSSPSSSRSPISSASAIDPRIASSAAIAGSSLRVEARDAACLAVAAASARSATIAWPAAFRPERGRARPEAAFARGRLAAPRAAPPRLRPPRRAADRFTLTRLRSEEDPPGIELLPDDPDLVRPGGRRLDQIPRHLHVPADVLLDLLRRDAGVDRDQHHLARLGIEAVDPHVGDHEIGPPLEAEALALPAAAQVPRARDEVDPLRKGALRVADGD